MNANTGNGSISRAAGVVSIGKDLVSFLRDAALFGLAVLLLAFPKQFNVLLVNAGFEEGSVVGFKWKSNLIDSNEALIEANETIAQLQKSNDELSAALADFNTGSVDPQLRSRVSELTEENQRLKGATAAAQASLSQTIKSNTPLVEKALSSVSKRSPYKTSDYLVGVQTVGFPDSERVDLNEELRSRGYRLHPLSGSYDERPSWFAYEPTVLHYSASSGAAAQELADFLQEITGQKFAVQRGSGLGVDPDERPVTLFVHYREG